MLLKGNDLIKCLEVRPGSGMGGVAVNLSRTAGGMILTNEATMLLMSKGF
jgi:hypothetical protein